MTAHLKYKPSGSGLIASYTFQFRAYIVLSLIVLLITSISHFTGGAYFEKYIGSINPIIAVSIISILGFAGLSNLKKKFFFEIFKGKGKDLMVSSALAVPFAFIMVFVDWWVVFPADMNVKFPESLLFYPAIGFIVEIIFHILPLTLILLTGSMLFSHKNPATMAWISMLPVSLIEPVYQVIFLTGSYSTGTLFYIGIHLLLTNLLQLAIFRRYDFISMYVFRLMYYLIWHVIWGHIRLEALF